LYYVDPVLFPFLPRSYWSQDGEGIQALLDSLSGHELPATTA